MASGESSAPQTKRVKSAIPLVAAVAVFLLLSIGLYRDYITDDLFIHLQFARNISTGNGFAFNPGQPVYGSSSALWVLLVAFLGLFSQNFLLLSKILGILFGVGSLLLFFKLSGDIIDKLSVSFLICVLLAVDPWFSRWAASGMEVPAVAFFVILGIISHRKEIQREFEGFPFSPIIFAIVTWLRPEGVMLFLFALISLLLNAPKGKKTATVLKALGIYVVTFLPWLLYAYFTFGRIIPTTAMVKSGGGASLRGILIALFEFGKIYGATYLLMGVLISLALLRYLRRGKPGLRRILNFARQNFLILAWVVILPLVYASRGLLAGSRYLTPSMILILIAGGLGIEYLLSPEGRIRTGRKLIPILIILLLVFEPLLVNAITYGNVYQGGVIGYRQAHEYIGKWIEANTPESAIIAAWDVGVVAYYSHRRIIDVAGLMDPEILKYEDRIEYIKEKGADYLVIQGVVPEELLRERPELRGVLVPLFTREMIRGPGRPDPVYFTVYKCNFRN